MSHYHLLYRGLPQELLDIIFAELLIFPADVKFRRVHRPQPDPDGKYSHGSSSNPVADLNVLFLNRDTYKNNSRVFYSSNEFSFGYEGNIDKDLAVFSYQACTWIRKIYISAFEMRTDGPQTASLVLVNNMMDRMIGLRPISVEVDLRPTIHRCHPSRRNAPFHLILGMLQRLLTGRIDSIRLIQNDCIVGHRSPETLHTVRVLRAFDFSDRSTRNWRRALRMWYKEENVPHVSETTYNHKKQVRKEG